MTIYAAKCFWPGSTELEVAHATGRIDSGAYVGAMFFPADELVLCLFAGASRRAIQRTVARSAIPSERLMESVWMPARDGPRR